jgi:hypothetical protein
VTDLDAAIRERLALDENSHYFRYDSEMIQGAILTVLDIHKRNGPGCCTECWEFGPGYEGEPVPYPCPTVLAIAKGLGIEI